jgi:hypothetical protein
MMRPALDVVNPILAQLRLEARGPTPTGILAALVGKHLLGHPILGDRRAVHLQHVLGRLAAKDVYPHHVAGVVIHKTDEVGVLPSQTEGEDVGLPHLVGRGALKEARLLWISRRLGFPLLQQLLLVERAANRLPAHGQKERPPQELADLLDAQVGMTTLELDDFGLDRRRHPAVAGPLAAGMSQPGLQAGLALLAVHLHPLGQGAQPHAHFASYLLGGEAFFKAELNRFAPDFIGVGANVRPAFSPRRPPRGAGPPLVPLDLLDTFHR